MKSLFTAFLLLAAAFGAFAQDVDSLPPVVVKTVPQSGDKSVPPGVVEIQVTFSKEMTDNSWSWTTAWSGSAPELVEKPKFDKSKRTCVLKVKLEPGKNYGYWLNSDNARNFKDSQGRPSVPYLLVFKTRP